MAFATHRAWINAYNENADRCSPLTNSLPRSIAEKTQREHAKRARANRVGRLRGYGNAIVIQTAAVFVRAVMAAIQVDATNRHR
jgi:hypothetical protein